MTDAEIQKAWEEAREARISVAFTTYRGTGHSSRPDKAMHLLSAASSGGRDAGAGALHVLVGDRGTRGPATLKSGTGSKSLAGFKSNAFFSLTNAGFERAKISTTAGTFEKGWDLWEACFQEHHSRSLEAKKLFIALCGGEAPSAFAAATDAAGTVIQKRETAKAKPSYETNPLYGLI